MSNRILKVKERVRSAYGKLSILRKYIYIYYKLYVPKDLQEIIIFLVFFYLINLNRKEVELNHNVRYTYHFNYPFLSLNIIIYNKIGYLPRIIKSLNSQNQSISPYVEIVFVDDGSVDGSFEYILYRKKYANNKRVVAVRHNFNKGSLSVRRTGIINSAGQYIFQIDADDELHNSNSIIDVIHALHERSYPDVLEIKAIRTCRNKSALFWRCRKDYSSYVKLTNDVRRSAVSWNVATHVVKRSLLVKSIEYIYPLMEHKKYIFAEDQLIMAFVYLHMDYFFCSNIYAYIYYTCNANNSLSGSVQPKTQNLIQGNFSANVMKLITSNAPKYRAASTEHYWEKFFENKKNVEIYRSIGEVRNRKNSNFSCKNNVNLKNWVFRDDEIENSCVVVNSEFKNPPGYV